MHSAERGSVGLVLGDSFGGGSRIDRGVAVSQHTP